MVLGFFQHSGNPLSAQAVSQSDQEREKEESNDGLPDFYLIFIKQKSVSNYSTNLMDQLIGADETII